MTNARHVVIVGAGGREHALALRLSKEASVTVAPGSPAMARNADGETFEITVTSRAPEELDADLFVIGPEAPLVSGLGDRLRAQGKLVFGPGADGAMIEGSKAFMKALLDEAGIPTAAFGTFTQFAPAAAFLETMSPPYVIKTDGLAAGKGVLVTNDLDNALEDLANKLSGTSFGTAGTTVVIEEGLVGTECSLLALCDGTRVVPLCSAQDYKRLLDGDQGPNTGGMGAIAPVVGLDAAEVNALAKTTIEPLVSVLIERGIDYRGVLYAGIMLTDRGPKVLEFNARFGDPETEVVVPLIDGDLCELLSQAARGELSGSVQFTGDAAICVVLAAAGYPDKPLAGASISGLGSDGQLAHAIEGVTIYHSGTTRAADGAGFVVSGGRVLTVTAVAKTATEARERVQRAIAAVHFEGCQVRTDIGHNNEETR